jgi:hypothetical protein
MKKIYFVLVLFSSFWLHAQIKVKGIILDQNGKPLQGASVYMSSTTIGTVSDADGYFSLSVEHGYYTLVASYIGLETTSYNLNTLDLPNEIVFQMVEKSNQLDEIVMQTKWESRRGYFLKQFKKSFLGETALGRQARIKNLDAIRFNYDKDTNILEAYAIEPLIIENRGLGYKITYDLVHFELDRFNVSYLGFKRYENLKGNERKRRKWKRERKKAYNGSFRDFLMTTIHRQPTFGFVIDLVRLIPNPDPPSEEKILEAEEVIRKYEGWYRNPSTSNIEIQRKVESAINFLQKVEINRFIEILVKEKIFIDDYFKRDEDGMYLYIEDPENMAFRVKYLYEYEGRNYTDPTKNKGDEFQFSRLRLLDEKVLVNSMGLLHNPLDVLLEGHWAFEKVPDQLPLDYKPKDPMKTNQP